MGREVLHKMPPAPNLVVPHGPDPNQFGELRLADSGTAAKAPVALLIHGGYWRAAYDLKHMGHIGADLRTRGVASWNIEYRRLGQPGGGWPGTGEDVRAGLLHLKELARKQPIDAERIVVIGFSAGGQLALWCAAEMPLPLRGAISLAGVADLRRAFELKLSGNVTAELMNGSPDEYPERYRAASPIERLPMAGAGRLRLFHGAKDNVVPVEISRRFAAAAQCPLTEFPEAGHFDLIDPAEACYREIRTATLALLRG